jgi:hypothetical protein
VYRIAVCRLRQYSLLFDWRHYRQHLISSCLSGCRDVICQDYHISLQG